MKRINRSPSIARASVLVGANVISSVPQYFERVVKLIWDKNDQHAEVDIRGPRYHPIRNEWTVAVFEAIVTFGGGEVLKITDNFSRKSSLHSGWTRKFSYFFGMPNADAMERIFLFDNHGLFGARGHLHTEDNERLVAGDPRLNGFSPEIIDIMDVCGYLDLYFDGKPFPWVAP